MIDKDRPSTWIRFFSNLCQGCRGDCCTMPVEVRIEDLIRLSYCSEDEASGSIKKLAKRLIKDKKIESYRSATGMFILARKPNGDCMNLDSQTRLCKVYDNRPGVCRDFPRIGPRPGFCPARRVSK